MPTCGTLTSYPGYPLLATFHTGVFYPLTLFICFLGDVRGWSFLVIIPSLASAVTDVFFPSDNIKVKKIGAVIGGHYYLMRGLPLAGPSLFTAAQAMIWMPLVLYRNREIFSVRKRNRHFIWLPFIFFFINYFRGHFQIMVYIRF